MSTLCKAKALYVKATVIQCGVPDYHGDILDAEAIKKVFTSFNNQNRFDIHHNRIPVDDVSLLENYISKSDEEIAGTLVPTGSWNIVLRIDNPVIQQKIMDGELQGVSLTTAIKEECRAGFTKTGNITYSELPKPECWLPVFISLVTEPANLVGLHVMDYEVYIEKSKHNNHIHKLGGKTLSFMSKLKKLIAEEEASQSEPVIEKATGKEEEDSEPVDETPKEEATTDKEEVVEETVKEEEDKKEEEVVEKAEDPQAEAEADAEVEAETEEAEVDLEAKIADLEARIAELEKQINKAEPTTESEPVEATTEDKVDDQPVITKSAKIEVTEVKSTSSNFYELSGRDPVTGKKIRPKTKVLN